MHFSTVTAFESPVSKQKVLPVLPAGRYYRKPSPDYSDWVFLNINRSLYASYLSLQLFLQHDSNDHRTALEDFDSLSADWDSMIDQLAERELGKYKICPNCNEPIELHIPDKDDTEE